MRSGLKITNISRGRSLEAIRHNLDTVKNVLGSEREARRILKEFRPDAVIGTGGYVCYPVLTEAHRLGIPTLVHESNAVPGLTTRMLARQVDAIMVGFPESREHYPQPEKVRVTGTPVRGEFAAYTKESAKRDLGLEPGEPLVVSVWGSLGSGHMNGIMVQLLPLLEGQREFRLIHSVGSRDLEQFRAALREKRLDPTRCNADTREYIYDMPRVMAAADLILCRAGASTLAELSYMGKPVLIVPKPQRNQQPSGEERPSPGKGRRRQGAAGGRVRRRIPSGRDPEPAPVSQTAGGDEPGHGFPGGTGRHGSHRRSDPGADEKVIEIPVLTQNTPWA